MSVAHRPVTEKDRRPGPAGKPDFPGSTGKNRERRLRPIVGGFPKRLLLWHIPAKFPSGGAGNRCPPSAKQQNPQPGNNGISRSGSRYRFSKRCLYGIFFLDNQERI
jgi:hypothetical protein